MVLIIICFRLIMGKNFLFFFFSLSFFFFFFLFSFFLFKRLKFYSNSTFITVTLCCDIFPFSCLCLVIVIRICNIISINYAFNLPSDQWKMPEIQLGAHTLRSHGVKVARIHMYDWLILVLLVVMDLILNLIEPFHRFVGEGMMTDLRYPLKGNTVPFWAVPVSFVPVKL
jgi:hypothetical protein